jgi:hypothetical protein
MSRRMIRMFMIDRQIALRHGGTVYRPRPKTKSSKTGGSLAKRTSSSRNARQKSS